MSVNPFPRKAAVARLAHRKRRLSRSFDVAGYYQARIAYYTWRGCGGYSYDDIPEM